MIGHHALRIVGWGQDAGGPKYWILANTWGEEWGERGLMRIVRGSNEARLEEMVTGAWFRGRRHRRQRRRRMRRHF